MPSVTPPSWCGCVTCTTDTGSTTGTQRPRTGWRGNMTSSAPAPASSLLGLLQPGGALAIQPSTASAWIAAVASAFRNKITSRGLTRAFVSLNEPTVLTFPDGKDFASSIWYFGLSSSLSECWLPPNAAATVRILELDCIRACQGLAVCAGRCAFRWSTEKKVSCSAWPTSLAMLCFRAYRGLVL